MEFAASCFFMFYSYWRRKIVYAWWYAESLRGISYCSNMLSLRDIGAPLAPPVPHDSDSAFDGLPSQQHGIALPGPLEQAMEVSDFAADEAGDVNGSDVEEERAVPQPKFASRSWALLSHARSARGKKLAMQQNQRLSKENKSLKEKLDMVSRLSPTVSKLIGKPRTQAVGTKKEFISG